MHAHHTLIDHSLCIRLESIGLVDSGMGEIYRLHVAIITFSRTKDSFFILKNVENRRNSVETSSKKIVKH